MLQSLKDAFHEPSGTKSSILQAMMSPAGLRVVWVVVEAEEDVKVYEKFMCEDSTIVKTSESETGRRGYANVEIIVSEIKEEVPVAHIIGIRDADYSRYKGDDNVPVNIFLTDRRDLEMMLLEAETVKQELRVWVPVFDEAFAKCIPVCRYFGYLRIYNEVADFSVTFHKQLTPNKYWDYQQQTIKDSWELDCTTRFVELSEGRCTSTDVKTFITTQKLLEENLYDVCRGHDFLNLLSLTLIDVQRYSVENMMAQMIKAYSKEDFKATRLYASIQAWQTAECVTALIA